MNDESEELVDRLKGFKSSVARNLLCPGLSRDVVDVSTVVFIPVGIDLTIFAQESALVERVLVRHVASL